MKLIKPGTQIAAAMTFGLFLGPIIAMLVPLLFWKREDAIVFVRSGGSWKATFIGIPLGIIVNLAVISLTMRTHWSSRILWVEAWLVSALLLIDFVLIIKDI